MPLALALSRASFSSSSLLSLLSLFLLVSMINEQIQEKTKSAQQRRSPMRKGTLRPRPQEKKKWTRARTSSRRSRALAAQTSTRCCGIYTNARPRLLDLRFDPRSGDARVIHAVRCLVPDSVYACILSRGDALRICAVPLQSVLDFSDAILCAAGGDKSLIGSVIGQGPPCWGAVQLRIKRRTVRVGLAVAVRSLPVRFNG